MEKFSAVFNSRYSTTEREDMGNSATSADHVSTIPKKDNQPEAITQREYYTAIGRLTSWTIVFKNIANIDKPHSILDQYTGLNLVIRLVLLRAIMDIKNTYSLIYPMNGVLCPNMIKSICKICSRTIGRKQFKWPVGYISF